MCSLEKTEIQGILKAGTYLKQESRETYLPAFVLDSLSQILWCFWILWQLMPYSDFSLYAPTHETVPFPLRWGTSLQPSIFYSPFPLWIIAYLVSLAKPGHYFAGSPGIFHVTTATAPFTFDSDHTTKHFYAAKAFRKQADNSDWKKIPWLISVLIWTQGELLIFFYIETWLSVPIFC